jgi:hypothetical protein
MKRALWCVAALFASATVWVSCVRFLFWPDLGAHFGGTNVPARADELAARHLRLWMDPQARAVEINRMRASNAEWDFMGRTFFVLSLANMCLRDPSRKGDYVPVMDAIIDETLRLEREQSMYVFLMSYARSADYRVKPERSLFVDGEIALMLAARRLVAEREEYRPLLTNRVEIILQGLKREPFGFAESYPDECWMFDHAMALAALCATDALEGTNHREFARQWLNKVREKVVHKDTGLLCSSFSLNGEISDGPEGSSIWLIAHCLQLVDAGFAEDQYRLAKRELARVVKGFGYAREWPDSWQGPMDIDSGPIIPVLGVSAGSSGLAFVGASAFGDRVYLGQLLSSLYMAGFPVRRHGELRFSASNQVGDAVMLYAMTLGPMWSEIQRRTKP